MVFTHHVPRVFIGFYTNPNRSPIFLTFTFHRIHPKPKGHPAPSFGCESSAKPDWSFLTSGRMVPVPGWVGLGEVGTCPHPQGPRPRECHSNMFEGFSGWWFFTNPSWKICASQIGIKSSPPKKGVNIKKRFETTTTHSLCAFVADFWDPCLGQAYLDTYMNNPLISMVNCTWKEDRAPKTWMYSKWLVTMESSFSSRQVGLFPKLGWS